MKYKRVKAWLTLTGGLDMPLFIFTFELQDRRILNRVHMAPKIYNGPPASFKRTIDSFVILGIFLYVKLTLSTFTTLSNASANNI